MKTIDLHLEGRGISKRYGSRVVLQSVDLALAGPGFSTAAILSFAHTVGEFGVVLMIGGNIPRQTRVVSTQIYGHVEALEYTQAHWLAGGMLLFSFVVLLLAQRLTRRPVQAPS